MSLASQIVSGALAFTAALTQQATNGLSLWGTFDAPEFPAFMINNPLPDGFPWGSRTSDTDYYHDVPTTNVVRTYTFNIARGKAAPDGFQKNVLLINGQFPGPVIEANWGDTIEVTLNNHITGPEEGTALHWHGFLQRATPWFDGVPSVQQCPVAPGASFTYRFKAELYGTTWYHSHYSSQYAGGLFGPLIVHGPKNYAYDIDLGPVMLSDWFHKEYFQIVKEVTGTIPTGWLPYSDNNLINGKMDFNCSLVTDGTPCVSNAGLAKFRFRTGKKHRLRLINAGAEGLQHFSIDGHEMTVIANDFVQVKPYKTRVVTLGIGQRTDVVVEAIGKPTDAYWMRANISVPCSLTVQPNALAAIYYDKADPRVKPNSTATPYSDDGRCGNDDLAKTVPSYPIRADPHPSVVQNIVIDLKVNATGHLIWLMNGQTFRGNFNHPLLELAHEGNTSYPYNPEWNVYDFGSNETVRVVVNNKSPASHPMHLHGHSMQVLHEGEGVWDGTSITNVNNPQRRDVQMVRTGGHLVIQYTTDNPGVWPFHCHIAWHLSSGLYVNFLEHPDAIAKREQIPGVVRQTCDAWSAYSNREVVDQIDSGV
ncbi:MAG: hypothetical protein M1826_002104 [Phylliscum demangeonii]|nr:MAG: hypothetical protein M1826_002104 [Phylliscum demangeonii]